LIAQLPERASARIVGSDAADRVVEPCIQITAEPRLSRAPRGSHLRDDGAQADRFGRGDALAGPGRRHTVEQFAHLGDLDCRWQRYAKDPGALVGLELDQALSCQFLQCSADDESERAEPLGQADLGRALIR
jgi:hypothetical protein